MTRHRVEDADQDVFQAAARTAIAALAERPGYLRSRLGRAVDDPDAWVLTTEWADIGSYRRALSAYQVKVDAIPLLSTAIDEATAYELLLVDEAGHTATGHSARAADASSAAPHQD